jgi:hypothetical protein
VKNTRIGKTGSSLHRQFNTYLTCHATQDYTLY